MKMGFLLLVSLLGTFLAPSAARPRTNPTGLFYHRLTLFTHGNEPTNGFISNFGKLNPTVNFTTAQELCASVGKTVPRLKSQQELNDMIAELNSMELYGNTIYCNHENVERRVWLNHKLDVKGQYRLNSAAFHTFADLNDNGKFCAALFWRDANTGYVLNGQPCLNWVRRHHVVCVRDKFYREIYREKYDVISPRSDNINNVNGRFNHAQSVQKCAHYGKQLVTVSSTQDVLDLQEELNRLGFMIGTNSRNFWLKDKVSGTVGNPVDPDNLVAGNQCAAIGQEYSSPNRLRVNTFIAPCSRLDKDGNEDDRSAYISLCMDDEPGRYHGRLTFHASTNAASAATTCANLGKVLPDVASDEDVMDLGREIKRIQPDTLRLASTGYWTSVTSNTPGAQYWADRTAGTNYCLLVNNDDANSQVKETWQLSGMDCTESRRVVCMTP